jgi:XTP/dITP diphosphohydrolase
MKKKIIFATGNQGKMNEVRMILKDMDYEVLSLEDVNIDINVVEDGSTFEENAMIKAKTIMNLSNEIVLADDSGLEVDFLDKAPGIYSARFLGEDTSYHIKNEHIVKKLEKAGENERAARFVCAIACIYPDGTSYTTRGIVEGLIGYEEKGENGFGYDPIFFLPEYGCTMAELSSEIKNQISHRGRALESMKKILEVRGV